MTICSVEGCGKRAFGHGLCNMHYSRSRRHGTTQAARPADWGERLSHPLYEAWKAMTRRDRSREKEWDDFWVFVKDVGDRPTENHYVSRLDEAAPFSKANFFWRERVAVKREGETQKEYAARYQKEAQRLYPDRIRNWRISHKFGMTVQAYDAMYASQGGVCAICKEPETGKSRGSEATKLLAVDHDHATGKIRALLCAQCNQALGMFRDKPRLLRAAIQYLEYHNGDKETNDDRPQAQD